MKKQIVIVLLVGATAFVLGIFVGHRGQSLPDQETPALSLKLQAVTKANEIDIAVAALSFLEHGDQTNAKALLEGQLQSALVALRILKPADLSEKEKAVISGSLSKGGDYAKQHGLD